MAHRNYGHVAKHMASKTESFAMCKTGHEHTANKETHKLSVHTKHDKHESMQPVKNTSCVPHRTRQNKRKQNEDNECTRREERTARANSRPHAPTARPSLGYECPNPDTKPELGLKQDKSAGIQTPRSNMKQSMKQERKQDKKGVSGLCHKTMNKLDRRDWTLTGC